MTFLLDFKIAVVSISVFLCLNLVADRSVAQQATVVIGDDAATKDKMDTPFGVDFDSAGQMIIVEYHGGRIWSWDGRQLKHVGGTGDVGYAGDGGPVRDASFNKMHNVVIGPDDRWYISDHLNHRVRVVHPDGTVQTLAGTGEAGFSGDGGSARKAQLNMPISVSLSHDQSDLLIADIKNRRVRAVNLETGIIRTVAGNGKNGIPDDGKVATNQPLVDPRCVAMDSQGRMFILERGGHALRMIDQEGKIWTIAGTGKKGTKDGPALEATFHGPKHLTITPNGVIYIADDQNHLIRKLDPGIGLVSTVLGHAQIKLNRPHGVTYYEEAIYVADGGHHRILKLEIDSASDNPSGAESSGQPDR